MGQLAGGGEDDGAAFGHIGEAETEGTPITGTFFSYPQWVGSGSELKPRTRTQSRSPMWVSRNQVPEPSPPDASLGLIDRKLESGAEQGMKSRHCDVAGCGSLTEQAKCPCLCALVR